MKRNDYIEFKTYLLEQNIKHSEVARKIEMTNSLFSLKINRKNGRDFTLDEARAICNLYKISLEKNFS